ncbi:hypothetical protein CO667_16395 [Rhizobium sp. L43]|nr:hypothetical protein CO667_16395 [Rhizobium sp. L43]
MRKGGLGARLFCWQTSFSTNSTSSSALCRGSATYQPAADARDKPEHDEEELAGFVSGLRDLCPPLIASARLGDPFEGRRFGNTEVELMADGLGAFERRQL